MAFERLKNLFSKEKKPDESKKNEVEKPDSPEAAMLIQKIEQFSGSFGDGSLDAQIADDYARGMADLAEMPLSPAQAERVMKMHLEVMAKLRGADQLNVFVSGLRERGRFHLIPEAIGKIGAMRKQ